jgi:drug/metabolite transporter (DMT)-like permease
METNAKTKNISLTRTIGLIVWLGLNFAASILSPAKSAIILNILAIIVLIALSVQYFIYEKLNSEKIIFAICFSLLAAIVYWHRISILLN